MAASPIQQQEIAATFLEAERSGLRVAIKGRLFALLVIGCFLVFSRISNLDLVLEYIMAVTGFALLGLLHYHLIGTKFDRFWVKYIFITIDIAVLSLLMATEPLYDSVDLPQVMVFRNTVFPFYFVILGMAAFSLSPWLVLWTGLTGVTGWMGAFYYSIRNMTETLDWRDVGTNPTTEHFLTTFFNPNFIATGSRVQESFAYFVVAILIAVVIWRARKTVYRQLELDEQHRTITEVFAQYVPRKIADALIADRGLLEPVERTATVIFVDIAGFTKMTESTGAARTVTILNEFFEKTTNCISKNDGVVTQFIGDAVMATFNIPVEDPDHERNAVKAAEEILDLAASTSFDGHQLSVRIGICTGTVIGGSVGGGGRQCYTVYGDTVNLASRLENLNKEYGTKLLVAETTVAALPSSGFRKVDRVEVRGFSEPISIYSI
ncbi:MAG: adenylate/guanylate cyclase domain-containing protein [Proteobacteria bacterium]|nr:adenylate/guanylate cyclase domain-containing protein [Pseudomonadota bacterium]